MLWTMAEILIELQEIVFQNIACKMVAVLVGVGVCKNGFVMTSTNIFFIGANMESNKS